MLQISPDLYEKLLELEDLKKRLGAKSSESPNYSRLPSLDEMLPRYEAQWKKFWDHEYEHFDIEHEKSNQRVLRLSQNFSLQTMFEEWSSKTKGLESLLFKDIEGKSEEIKSHVTNLLSRWKINFHGKS